MLKKLKQKSFKINTWLNKNPCTNSMPSCGINICVCTRMYFSRSMHEFIHLSGFQEIILQLVDYISSTWGQFLCILYVESV